MPLSIPAINDMRYQQLVDEALARVPVHTPEWTNFSHSDPGVTLVQLFAFLTENMLYRANQVPERNRLKFLQLLGVPLRPASAAQALVTFRPEATGPVVTLLEEDLELRAGDVPFRTASALAVLPVESRTFFKRQMRNVPPELLDYYRLLYASYQTELPAEPRLYETVALDGIAAGEVDLGRDTVDQALWMALLAPPDVEPEAVRQALGGQTATIGAVPVLLPGDADARPGQSATSSQSLLIELPRLAASRLIPRDGSGRPLPSYVRLDTRADGDLLATPGTVQVTLPGADAIGMWQGLDPLEPGVGDLPPSLNDSKLESRLVTWLRIRTPQSQAARLMWCGVNTVRAVQREHVEREVLARGDGQPGQTRRLGYSPVLPGSVAVFTVENGVERQWQEIDDLMAAGPEAPVTDRRVPPGAAQPPAAPAEVFHCDHEAGVLTFGDGARGRRLPDATVMVSYDCALGVAGNVDAGAINAAPALPSGISVRNPVRSWGGADAEDAVEGERQIPRFLQHRDRLVNAEDFAAIAWRTPGADIGRIDVIPAFHPDLTPGEAGSAPGVVTIMAVPQHDAEQPDAPRANRLFVNAICAWLEPRRLVTTELVVRGPSYVPLCISAGIDVMAGWSVAAVTEAVKAQLRRVLSPLPWDGGTGLAPLVPLLGAPAVQAHRGWPLNAPVSARVLLAEMARVPGVSAVNGVLLAKGVSAATEQVVLTGLELPRLQAISIVAGDPVPLADLRGDLPTPSGPLPPVLLPVPAVSELC